MRGGHIAFVTLLAVCLPATASAEVTRYALIVGNNAPAPNEPGLKPLQYADDDAVRYYQMTRRLGAESVLLAVLDSETQKRYPALPSHARPPTKANLKRAVNALANKALRDLERGDEPIFYFVFAGHGSVNKGVSSLALVDGRITQEVLYEQVVGRVPAETSHVIIDACHAGGVVGSRGLFEKEYNTKSFAVSAEQAAGLKRLKQYPHVGVLLATTLGEEAHEWSQIQSGVFSHEVLSGLSGAADVNGDGAIEYSEIQAFVASANGKLKDRQALPRVVAVPPASNHRAALVSLSGQRGVAWLEGHPSALGHFYVELEAGQRYLDANLDSRAPVRIAIPAKEPLFVRTDEREAYVSAEEGQTIKLAKLSFGTKAVQARGSVEAQLRRNLFALPFSTTYYRGFVDSNGMTPVQFEDPALQDDAAKPKRKGVAIGLIAVSGAALASTAVAGGLMIKTKRDARTANQLASAEARSRYQTARAVAIGSSAAAIAFGIAGSLLWPKKKHAPLAVEVDPVGRRYAIKARLQF